MRLKTAEQLKTVDHQLTHIENEIAPLQTQFDDKNEQLSQIKNKQSDSEQNYHQAVSQTQRLQEQYDEQKSQHHSLQLQLTTLKNQQAICDNDLEQANKQRADNTAQQNELTLQLEEAEMPLLELDELIVLQHESLEVLLEEKEQKRRLLDVAKDNLHNAEKNIANEQGNLDKLTQQKQQAELDKQSFLLKSEAALAPLAELNRPLKEVLDELPQDTKLTHLQAMLSRTSSEIAGLGAINLAAVEEFDKASERKVYLDQQYDDLTTALSTLETAITKIDRETKQRFKGTFDQINAGLQNLFPKVFGGGHAYLELTSDDLLDTGVTIMARPPGKKNATIHLLSGGEKALTALSLVFSIFQLNPAPFCMLDEVDAPLDDANVGRFCRLVDEMSHDVQFIYISHNKISMEMAGRLTGVTMAEPGVSRVVAVDIEKALEMTQTA
jgi:chromosome segregation protein